MNQTRIIDLRSDTVTLPSAAMMEAIAVAELGDDVYGGDPTVQRLERAMAERTGMEAGLFVTSGTQSNLTALMAHLGRGEEFIVGDAFHIFQHEALGSAVLGSLAPHPLATPEDGCLDPAEVEAAIRPDDVHYPVTRLLCLENTFNGVPIPLEHQDRLAEVAHRRGLKVHLDGARLFNAAIALGVDADRLCENVDSVSVCLSKGLGAPVGSVLCGARAFVERSRRIRKMLGGGLRQAGILAACGLVALEREVPRLGEDHDNAARLAAGINAIEGVEVASISARTNMVFVVPHPDDHGALRRHLEARGILTGAQRPSMRLVTHRDVSAGDVDTVIAAFAAFYERGVRSGASS
jgi:threonine aldolase